MWYWIPLLFNWCFRLKNQLEYSSGKPAEESELLAKIEKLENQVLDFETSERKNKRQIDELQEVEKQLREKVETLKIQKEKEKAEKEDIEKDKYQEVLGELKLLEVSDRDLQEKIIQLGHHDLQGLVGRIGELERSEKALKRKVELLQTSEPSFSQSAGVMLDTPEAILRQQIRDLEKLERHLKQQVRILHPVLSQPGELIREKMVIVYSIITWH